MTQTPNSLACILLASHLAWPDSETLSPLTSREWQQLRRHLASKNIEPSSLLTYTSAELVDGLNMNREMADRLALLLARQDELQQEIDRLSGRGIYPVTSYDADYPQRYRERLKESAPPILFYSGEVALLGQPGIAVVGSRNLDEAGMSCAEFVGNQCGLSGLVLYSGGARGVDTISMKAALSARGSSVGILADSLEKTVRDRDWQKAIERGDLCLVSPYAPSAGFSVGAAMGRNRLIYTLADYALVVASDVEKGGTWAGATEALKNGWLPLFALDYPAMPEGNRMLLKKGAHPFPYPFPEKPSRFKSWMEEECKKFSAPPSQASLF